MSRRSVLEAARLVPGQDPQRVADVVRATARRIWREAPDHAVALALGISSWEALWSGFEGGHPDLDGLRTWSRDYASRVWGASLAQFGVEYDSLAGHLDWAYRRAQRDADRTLEGVPELLARLRGTGVKLALLTNGPPDIQRQKLARAGLAGFFDAIAISGETGAGKPDPIAFEHLKRALGVDEPPLMVGDSWDRDVRGALSAGWPAVWVSHGRSLPEAHPNVAMVEDAVELGR